MSAKIDIIVTPRGKKLEQPRAEVAPEYSLNRFGSVIDFSSKSSNAALGTMLATYVALMAGALGIWQVLGVSEFSWPAWALALLGLVLGALGRIRQILLAASAFFLICIIIGLTPLSHRLMEAWVRQDAVGTLRPQAIVVLSAGINSEGNLNGTSADRLLTGLELLTEGIAPLIVTTRTIRTIGGVRLSSDADQRRLIRAAHGSVTWTILDSVATTKHESDRAAAFLMPKGIQTIAIVTSPAHTRRACATFEHVGFTVYCVPARERGLSTRRPIDPLSRLAAFRFYLYERLGMRAYASRGWVR